MSLSVYLARLKESTKRVYCVDCKFRVKETFVGQKCKANRDEEKFDFVKKEGSCYDYNKDGRCHLYKKASWLRRLFR